MLFRIFLSIYLLNSINGYNITLYSLDSRQGSSFDIVSDSCVNIPQWFLDIDDGVSGVWIKDTTMGTSCIVLHTESNCSGYMLYMRPGTLYHANLQRVGFDNRAKSVGSCEMIKVERGTPVLIRTIFSLPFLLCCVITAVNASIIIAFVRNKIHDRKLHTLLQCELPPIPVYDDKESAKELSE